MDHLESLDDMTVGELKRDYSDTADQSKVFAYVIYDCLNCVTLDAWPAQSTIAKRMRCSVKTVHRAADGLEQKKFVLIVRSRLRDVNNRYAPIFSPGDLDIIVSPASQSCPETVDADVRPSSLSICLESSSSRRAERNRKRNMSVQAS